MKAVLLPIYKYDIDIENVMQKVVHKFSQSAQNTSLSAKRCVSL